MAFMRTKNCGCGCGSSPCDDLPTILSIQCRSRTASLTKCGYTGFTGGSVPNIYRTSTPSGSIYHESWDAPSCGGTCYAKCVLTWSGSCTYARLTCSLTDTSNRQLDTYSPCATPFSSGGAPDCGINDAAGCAPTTTDTTVSDTVFQRAGVGCVTSGGASEFYGGIATQTLSDVYSTVELCFDVDVLISGASWGSYSGSCPLHAFSILSSDQTSLTRIDVQTQITFSAGVPAGSKLTYNEYDAIHGGSTPFCIDLAPGQTTVVIELDIPGCGNNEFYVDNFVLACGAC